jgi:hypothetical protein
MDFFLVSLSNVSAFAQYSSRVWDVRHFFFADVVYFIIVEAVLSPSILFRHENQCATRVRVGWVCFCLCLNSAYSFGRWLMVGGCLF